jgi:hypothetical protein
MSVILHDGVIRQFFHSEEGELGRYISRKSQEIVTYAHNNLSAHVRSGDAIQSLRDAGIFQEADSLYSVVLADAAHPWRGHPDFNYPIALELGGVTPQGAFYQYPFLAPALIAAGFRRGA